MLKFLKRNYVLILLFLLAAAFTVLSAFGLGNFSSPSSFYQTGEIEKTDYYSSVCFCLDYKESKYSLDSVWINFGSKDYTDDTKEIIVYTSLASSEETRFYKTDSFIKSESGTESDSSVLNTDDGAKAGDWQVLCKNPSSYKKYKYFLLSTNNKVKINELAFVGVDESGNRAVLDVKAVGAGGKKSYYGSDSPLDKSGEFPQDEDAKTLANRLIDEQSKFDINKTDFENYEYTGKSGFTESERFTVESVRNLTSGRGIALDLTANPLGQYLIAVGIGVFGATSFGVRIIPFIFALLSLFAAYFIGKLLTGKPVYGLIFALLFAFGGYSLFFATTGKVDAIFAFFILCAFYSSAKFVKKGISGKAPRKGYVNVILGGAAISFAISVKTVAIFYIIPLLAVMTFGIVKQYVYAKEKGVNKTAGFKNKFGVTVTLCVVGYALLPIISVFAFFIFGYAAYSSFFAVNGVTEYMSGAFFKIFNTAATGTANYSSPIGFIINYSAESFSATKFAFSNLVLVAVNVLSLFFCGAMLIARFIKKREDVFFSADGGLRVYAALIMFALFGWLLLLTFKCGAGEFYLPSVFFSGISVLALKLLNEEDKKPIIGKTITATKIFAGVIALAIAVMFALSVPAFLGLAADKSIYAFQVISPLP